MLLTFYRQLGQMIGTVNFREAQNISMDDLFNLSEEELNNISENIEEAEYVYNNEKYTVETNRPPRSYNTTAINTMTDIAESIVSPLIDKNINEMYRNFSIPKRSGGLRTISAPTFELKECLRLLKEHFEKVMKVLPHNCAYAYTKDRSPKKALEKHQLNKSRWFLKLDVKDFFPSCNQEFIIKQMKKIYPFYYIDENRLKNIIQYCMLNGGLPQGSPISPFLSNIVMLPIDYKIDNMLKTRGFIYTRYADDILISHKYDFNFQTIENMIKEIFISEEAPFNIKEEKTRYGSSSGRNWNLGLMLNKDNHITIGNERKKVFKIMLNNFLDSWYDETKQHWDREDTYKLQGIISYYLNIEPKYITDLIHKYENKYINNNNYKCTKDIIKAIINEDLIIHDQVTYTTEQPYGYTFNNGDEDMDLPF